MKPFIIFHVKRKQVVKIMIMCTWYYAAIDLQYIY